MKKPASIIMIPGRKLAAYALARNLYPSPIGAFAELIFNGLDAANLRGVTPEIEIRFWKIGEHPLSPDGPAISVLDNGTGLTPKALAAYCKVGESVHEDKTHIHGKHGVGKLAAFALAPEEGAVYYLTTNTGEGTWMYRITSDVFAAGGFEPIPVGERRPGLPKASGTFTEIFIPNVQGGLTADTLLKELPAILPLRPWKVMVQGQEVKKRALKCQEPVETPHIPLLKGLVRIELGVVEVASEGDAVLLVDADSGRSVGDLHSLPPVARRALDPLLLHPKLVGQILVPGLESQSAVSRSGLTSQYWTSTEGRKLIEVLLAFAVPLARKLLKEEAGPKEGLKKVVTLLGDVFARGFGPPDLDGLKPKGQESSRPKEPSRQKPSPRPSRRQENSPNPSNLRSSQRSSGVFVRIEDTTYQVLESPSKSELPAVVRGHTILINTDHPAVRALDSRASRAMLETTVDMTLWAHLLSTREMNHETLAIFYQLRVRALAS